MDAIDRIRDVISDNNLSLKEFSDLTGVQYRTLQRYMAKDRAISSDLLHAMTDRMDVSASWVLSGRGNKYLGEGPNGRTPNPDFIQIQRFDLAASAGHGALAEAEIGTGYYAFNRGWLTRRDLNPDDLAVIAVRGDSMEPELYDNDLILLDRSKQEPRDGDMYVVRYSGDLFVKRVQVVPGNKVELRSTNRFYGPIRVDLPQADAASDIDLTFIGKVVASMHEW